MPFNVKTALPISISSHLHHLCGTSSQPQASHTINATANSKQLHSMNKWRARFPTTCGHSWDWIHGNTPLERGGPQRGILAVVVKHRLLLHSLWDSNQDCSSTVPLSAVWLVPRKASLHHGRSRRTNVQLRLRYRNTIIRFFSIYSRFIISGDWPRNLGKYKSSELYYNVTGRLR